MKILFLTEELSVGGKERRLVELLKGLSKFPKEYEIHLTLAKSIMYFKEIEQFNINIHILKPVSNLQTITIKRQRLALLGGTDHEWNKLLGELIRAVVVGAIRNDRRQAVGMVVGAHQHVTGCFAGRVGRVRRVGCGLGEEPFGAERAVNFVGGDVVEPCCVLRAA